jgi:hypothetical protein
VRWHKALGQSFRDIFACVNSYDAGCSQSFGRIDAFDSRMSVDRTNESNMQGVW